jgi:hypothetical protein
VGATSKARGGWLASECGSLGFGSMREEEQCQNDTVQILFLLLLYIFLFVGIQKWVTTKEKKNVDS